MPNALLIDLTTLYLPFLLCVAIGCYIQTLTGFAFGIILVSLASTFNITTITQASNTAMILTCVNAWTYFRSHKTRPPWDFLKNTLKSSAAGVVLGVIALSWLSLNALQVLRGLLGVSIILCAILLLLQTKPQTTFSNPFSFVCVGFLSGLLGGMFSASGPPLIYHLYRQPLATEYVRQCLVFAFAFNAVIRSVLVVGSGQFALHDLGLALAAIPIVYFVSILSYRYPLPLGKLQLRLMTAALLGFAGISLVWTAIH